MRWSLNIGRLFGIRLELHVTFVLFVAWVVVQQAVLTGQPSRALAALALLGSVFACVVLHELGHALTARRFGIATRDIVLLPIGGVARLERMPERPSQELLVALAGPAVNVVIAALLVAVLAAAGRPLAPGDLRGGLLETLLLVNLAMVAFNLLPAFPMDGGRVLRALLAMRLSHARATRIASGVGQGAALLIGVAGLFVLHNAMLAVIAMFVYLAAGEEGMMARSRTSLTGLAVRAAMRTDFRALDVRDPLRRAVAFLTTGGQKEFPVLDGEELRGVLTRPALVAALERHGMDAAVGDAMLAVPCRAEAGDPLEPVFARMRAGECSTVPVLDRGRLVGLVTADNVGELLQVREALRRHASGA